VIGNGESPAAITEEHLLVIEPEQLFIKLSPPPSVTCAWHRGIVLADLIVILERRVPLRRRRVLQKPHTLLAGPDLDRLLGDQVLFGARGERYSSVAARPRVRILFMISVLEELGMPRSWRNILPRVEYMRGPGATK
jgi:hypothetical protein